GARENRSERLYRDAVRGLLVAPRRRVLRLDGVDDPDDAPALLLLHQGSAAEARLDLLRAQLEQLRARGRPRVVPDHARERPPSGKTGEAVARELLILEPSGGSHRNRHHARRERVEELEDGEILVFLFSPAPRIHTRAQRGTTGEGPHHYRVPGLGTRV